MSPKSSKFDDAALEAVASKAPVREAGPKTPVDKKPNAAPAYAKLRGRMIQTTITMTPEDLASINAAAEAVHMKRADFIRRAVLQVIESKQKLVIR